MKTHALTAIVIAMGITTGTAALAADEGTPRTRAEVIAERDAARASGWITAMTGEDSGSFYLSQQRWVSQRTRAEVAAETKAARDSGLLAEFQHEGSETPVPTRQARTGTAVRYAGPNIGNDASSAPTVAQASTAP